MKFGRRNFLRNITLSTGALVTGAGSFASVVRDESESMALKNIKSLRVPNWYLNRRKDMDTGTDVHLITSDLDFIKSNDIDREKSIMSWRGYRHMFGLRVRGQRTRNTRRRATAVGVKKVAGKAPASGNAPK